METAWMLLPIDATVATRWGELNVPDPVPTVDGLLAATALVHDLTLVTRNVRDVIRQACVCLIHLPAVHQPDEGSLERFSRYDRVGTVQFGVNAVRGPWGVY